MFVYIFTVNENQLGSTSLSRIFRIIDAKYIEYLSNFYREYYQYLIISSKVFEQRL